MTDGGCTRNRADREGWPARQSLTSEPEMGGALATVASAGA